MKKCLIILPLCFLIVACTNNKNEKFMATNVKELTFEDSNGQPITLNVEYWFGMPNDETAPINKMILDKDDYKEFVHQLFFDTGFYNSYLFEEYTYTPIKIYDWQITDTLQYKNDTIFIFKYFVECRSDNKIKTHPRNMYAWHEVWENIDDYGVVHDKVRKWWLMDVIRGNDALWHLERIIDKYRHD